MDHSKKSTYLFSVDVLRVIAILGVILIHQTTTTLQSLNHNVAIIPFTLFLNQASRFAVPLFFLISGFVLELNNKTGFSYITFFRKRASRILIPYLFWSFLYYGAWHGFYFSNFIRRDFLTSIINGTSSYHLYFIPSLIIFYLLFPLFHKFINVIKNPIFLSVIFIIQMGLSFYNYYFKLIPLQEDIRVALLVFSMFVIGMAASHYRQDVMNFSKKYFKALLFLILALVSVIFFETYKLTIDLKTNSFIYNQYGPLNYIYTLVLALCLLYPLENVKKLKALLIKSSKLSFFVFFVHVFILQNIWSNLIKVIIEKNGNSYLKYFWFDPLVFLIISAISFIIAYLIHKIPYASKITG